MSVVSMGPIHTTNTAGAGRAPDGLWWLTNRATRRVLVMAQTMTSVKRLLDIAGLFNGDLRVQLVFTVPPNVLNQGAGQMLAACGAPVLAWEQATRERFDLAVTANFGGLADVDAPIAVFSHGASRNSVARPRGRGSFPVTGPVVGFSRSDLIRAGMLVPAALALGHERELELLEQGCPEALRIAAVVGDPCYDRLTSAAPYREEYRTALGLREGQKLVVATSTWRDNSLLGGAPHMIEQLIEQLPAPEYRLVLLTHPNIWAAHGEYQMHAWYGHWAHRGLVFAGPHEDWQPLLASADYVIGDHGSVTLYGAVTGVPVLLGAFPERDVHPSSGAAALGALVPRLTGNTPIPVQLAHAAAQYDPAAMAEVAALITSEPGGFARHTRRLLYGLLGLGQPAVPARLPSAPPPRALDEICALPTPRRGLGRAA
jgi:CDP-Glycerol:Poly(glycerophosphate) glycerophosphotransferase